MQWPWLLALVSGFLFGIVPVRQVLRTNPYQIVKAGPTGTAGRRITVRDLLLVVQIAICAVLVTSSMVAVRGLARSLHSNFGFEPRNAMLVDTDLSMAGYTRRPGARHAKAHDRCYGDDSRRDVGGIRLAGLPLDEGGFTALVFTDRTTDLRPSNAAARRHEVQDISRILPGGGHSLAGREEPSPGMTIKTRRAWPW